MQHGGRRSMTMQFVTDYLDQKIKENENFIRYTFYELRVKNDLSEEEVDEFLRINRDYFENKGYKDGKGGRGDLILDEDKIVEPNELMIAIKEEQKGIKK